MRTRFPRGILMPLSIKAREHGPALVFELLGALDCVTAEQLEPLVLAALDAGRLLIVFDLTGLTFVSSGGLRIFLITWRRLQGRGEVRFAGPRPEIRQIFNVTALTTRVDLYPSLADALCASAR
jgi:anti-anti-sigma factor